MTTEKPVPRGGEGRSHDDDDAFQEALAGYLDRLNSGEMLHREEILENHPDWTDEIVSQLEIFQELGEDDGSGAVLGRFGRYEIVSELGRGGMGTVYEAIDRDMDRRVALKVLPAGLKIHKRSVVRFRREARIIGKLRHPNIVAVYATGIENETPYISMEFVEGESLEEILERKRPKTEEDTRGLGSKVLTRVRNAFTVGQTAGLTPPPSEKDPAEDVETGEPDRWPQFPSSIQEMELTYCLRMARTFAAVAEGLQHAHSKGVIHRDLKPSNLILDGEENLRILDFGLARLEGQDSLTGSGEVVGTPRYMSPEQVRAHRVSVDHRTDIYSLGATLYEALTLRPPFHGRNAEETLSQIVHRDPRPLRQLNPRVPRDLETIVLKCLRKNPQERYGTAEALAQELHRCARGDPIEARPLSLGEKISRRIWQHKGKAAAGVAALLLVLCMGWLAYDRAAESHRRRVAEYDNDVVSALVTLQTGGVLAEKADRFVWSSGDFDFSRLLPGGLGWSTADLIRNAIRSLERCRDAVPERPEAHYHLARGLLLLGEDEKALSELSHAVERGFVPAMFLQARLHERRGEPELAESLVARARNSGDGTWAEKWLTAHLAMAERRWAEAAGAYSELIELERARRSPYLGASVEIYLGCGIAQLELEDYERARQNFVAAGALWPRSVEPDFFLGATYLAQGAEEAAEEIFEKLFRRHPSDELASMIGALYSYRFWKFAKGLAWAERMGSGHSREVSRAFCLAALGRQEGAIEAARKLLELYPDEIVSYVVALDVILDKDVLGKEEIEEAARWARRLIELAPRSALPYTFQAEVYQRQDRRDESFEMWQKAVEVEPTSARALYHLGDVLAGRGETERAAHLIRKAIELSEGTKAGFLGTGVAQLVLGKLLETTGEKEEALTAYEEGIELCLRKDTDVYGWFSILPLLADAQFATGRRAEAVRSLEEALEHPGTPPRQIAELETRLEEYAEAALPDLPTYRSIDRAVASLHRAALVAKGATWRYFKGKEAPSPGLEWTRVDFPDTGWDTGASGFGYGDGDDATVLDDMRNGYTSLYIRHSFEVADPGKYERLLLSVTADDGFVAYLNGVELARARIGPEPAMPHDALASETVVQGQEPPVPFERSELASLLRAGRNVLAVQGLNAAPDSSDFSLIPVLYAESPPDVARAEKLLDDFRRAARGPGAEGRLAYLEGRLLAERREHEQAAERFATALAGDPGRPEPLLALAESLPAAGRRKQAERRLREMLEMLEKECPRKSKLWEAWAAVALAGLELSPQEVLSSLPCERVTAETGGRAGGDSESPEGDREELRWLLERLENREPIRINCGGERYRSPRGVVWERDRFYTRGRRYLSGQENFAGGIENTADAPLYRTERYFPPRLLPPPEYRIPLPPGSYRVTLHFAEIWYETSGKRLFDVVVEGVRILELFDPCAAGFATAQSTKHEVEVEDGLLNIEFRGRRENPKISAIEIERLK